MADGCDTVWNCNTRQSRATVERMITNTGDTIRYLDANQIRPHVESLSINGGNFISINFFRNNDFLCCAGSNIYNGTGFTIVIDFVSKSLRRTATGSKCKDSRKDD